VSPLNIRVAPEGGFRVKNIFFLSFLISTALSFTLFFSCASNAVSAEEYYAIGMAYFDMGKYAESEKWFIKARSADKTMYASEYNLGRIAFEKGRYEEAVERFDAALAKDPQNITALKAAAYTRIKTGEFEKAESYYEKVLALVPESADSGYNYALILYALGKYAESEAVLAKYQAALLDNRDVLLLYARAQKAQGKPEAADSYAQWLTGKDDPKVRYEYATCLENAGVFVKALEEYRAAYQALSADSKAPAKPDARFATARVLLIADPENAEGIAELEGAVMDGFADSDALEALLENEQISQARKTDIQRIIENRENMKNPPKPDEGEKLENPVEQPNPQEKNIDKTE
jgi:tetratricopeptide (TPR) repeat protein